MAKPKWIDHLQQRWGVSSARQVLIILVVFACTGFTAMAIKQPVFNGLGVSEQTPGWLRAVIYMLTVLPAYQLLLLAYGFLFGQFTFFWNFEKRLFGRIGKLFVRK
jgi:hypothetical protein